MISLDAWFYCEFFCRFEDCQATYSKSLPPQQPVNVGWMPGVQMLGSKDFYICIVAVPSQPFVPWFRIKYMLTKFEIMNFSDFQNFVL